MAYDARAPYPATGAPPGANRSLCRFLDGSRNTIRGGIVPPPFSRTSTPESPLVDGLRHAAPAHQVVKIPRTKLTHFEFCDFAMAILGLAHNLVRTGAEVSMLYNIYREHLIDIDPQELMNNPGWAIVIDAQDIQVTFETKAVPAVRGAAASAATAATDSPADTKKKGKKKPQKSPPQPAVVDELTRKCNETATPAAIAAAKRQGQAELRIRSKASNDVGNLMTDEQARWLLDRFFERYMIISTDKVLSTRWETNEQFLELADPKTLGSTSISTLAQCKDIKQTLGKATWKIFRKEIEHLLRNKEPLPPDSWTTHTLRKDTEPNILGNSKQKPMTRLIDGITEAMLFCPQQHYDEVTNPINKNWETHPHLGHLSTHPVFANSKIVTSLVDLIKSKMEQEKNEKASKLPDRGLPDIQDESEEEEDASCDEASSSEEDDPSSDEDESEEEDADSSSDEDEGSTELEKKKRKKKGHRDRAAKPAKRSKKDNKSPVKVDKNGVMTFFKNKKK